jgi:hypothetical protein
MSESARDAAPSGRREVSEGLTADSIDVAEIRRRVREARDLRADAGEEIIRRRGSSILPEQVDPDLPIYAKMRQAEFTYFRWANAVLLGLCARVEALSSRDAAPAPEPEIVAWAMQCGDGRYRDISVRQPGNFGAEASWYDDNYPETAPHTIVPLIAAPSSRSSSPSEG